MVDVFLVGLLSGLVSLNLLANIEPGVGATFFGAVVVITMFAAHSFDPRLIWDEAGANDEPGSVDPTTGGGIARMSRGHDPAQPEVTERTGPSVVWLIPLLTALVGAWLVLTTLSEQGPIVELQFKTAEGIEIGKTKIKYKSVDIGLVEDVRFAEDFESVMLTVEFNPGSEHFLRRNTRFWVVKPQLSVRGVSGLSTLVSGSYIEIDPGPVAPQRFFVGLEEQPVIHADDAGTTITLVTDELGSVDAGSPIYYRGILAGEVLGRELGSDRQSVFIQAFIRDPFNQLVRGNSRFWNVSGMDVSMGADGFRLRTASVTSLMFGGLAFDTPGPMEPSTEDVSDLVFTLYESEDVIQEEAFTQKLRFVMYFDGSVRGSTPALPSSFGASASERSWTFAWRSTCPSRPSGFRSPSRSNRSA